MILSIIKCNVPLSEVLPSGRYVGVAAVPCGGQNVFLGTDTQETFSPARALSSSNINFPSTNACNVSYTNENDRKTFRITFEKFETSALRIRTPGWFFFTHGNQTVSISIHAMLSAPFLCHFWTFCRNGARRQRVGNVHFIAARRVPGRSPACHSQSAASYISRRSDFKISIRFHLLALP